MKPRIVNADSVPFETRTQPEAYECRIARVGAVAESSKLGYNITVIPPGKKAFPYHAHRGNEEMFFILEGEGTLRIDGERRKIRQGDFIAVPPGRESAHQIINDSAAELRYLAVSTMELPEVIEYPDSGKLGMIAGTPGGRPPMPDSIRHFARVADAVEYWHGE